MNKDYVINDNQTGPIAQRLFDALTDIQYGRVPDPYGWTQLADSGEQLVKSQRSANA